jgi:type IV secretion system protein VirB11
MTTPMVTIDDGLMPAKREQKRRYQEKLRRELGSLIGICLADPRVIEIMLNPDGRLWVERSGGAMTPLGRMSAPAAEQLIATVAAGVGAAVTYDSPALECELPDDGSRFSAMIYPGADGPMFTIRRRASQVWTLADYERGGILSAAQGKVLRQAIAARRNILVAGGTGSGKTTLANALIAEIATTAPEHRLVIIEDTPEIQCASPNAVILRATEANAALTMQRLLMRAMRHRPDRIIVGEVRGAEALTLIKAWNTGHPGGIATIHANEATDMDALRRLESLVGEATPAPMQPFIAQAVNLVVSITRASGAAGRRVRKLIRVEDFADGAYRTTRV